MATSNKVFSLFSFICFLLCCIPFPRHMQAWNTGTCLLMVWNGLACLIYFVNSIVWNSNIQNSAPVWCDITSRLGLAFGVGVPMAVLCISRRLYLIIAGNTIITRTERRRAVTFDLALGLGIPVIDVILLYIPQNGRFLIFEDFGCSAFVSNTPVGVVLSTGPQLVIALVCTVYSILTTYVLYKKRSGLSEILLSNGNISTTGYLRLLIIAVIGSACLVPLGIWAVVISWKGILPWPGWSATHAHMSYVEQVPASIWRSNRMLEYIMEITRWEFVFSASLFFACFGLHREARASYQSTLQRLVTCIKCLLDPKRSGSRDVTAPTGLLPLVFAHDSPRKILDINGGLSQTQNSFLSAVWYGDPTPYGESGQGASAINSHLSTPR